MLGIEHLDLVEDVVQDTFVRALRTWPTAGIPEEPAAWILTVAKNRARDLIRRRGRWGEKQRELERSILPDPIEAHEPRVFFTGEIADDELRLIFATCHPVLARDAQVALTLKTTGGFGVREIARAFLTSEATIAQRLVRAKRALRDAPVALVLPGPGDLAGRRDAVMEVLYLMFNEGYSATAGDDLVCGELCQEATRLAELLALHPTVGGPMVHALAALFLFQAARLPARTGDGGELLPLEAQDRARWDRRAIRRALEHHRRSAGGGELTAYHLQADIASCHALAPTFAATPWKRILARYNELLVLDGSPVIALNRAVAVAYVDGPEAGLRALGPLKREPTLVSYYRLFAVEAELLWRAGRAPEAQRVMATAIALASSQPVRSYLQRRAREYGQGSDRGAPRHPPAPDTS